MINSIRNGNKVWISGIILTGCFLFFGGNVASAATCNDQADGNWNSAATWDCGLVPDSDDDVTIDSHTVTNTADQSAKSVVISGGTLNMGSYTLTAYNTWTYSSGTINYGSSTLIFVYSTTGNFNPGSADYYNLKLYTVGYSSIITTTGTAKVKNNFIYQGGGSASKINGGQIDVEGNVTSEGSCAGGTTIINLIGNNDQDLGGVDTCNFPVIRIEKSGGILSALDYVGVTDGWTYVDGNVDMNESTLKIYTSQTFTPGDVDYYDLIFKNSGAETINISSDVSILNNLTLETSGNSFSLDGGELRVGGDFFHIGSNGVYGSSNIKFIGDGNQNLYPNTTSLSLGITIEKTAGSFYLHDTLYLDDNWTWISGEFVAGTSKLKFRNAYNFKPGNVQYYDVEIWPVNSGSSNVSLQGDLYVSNLLRIDATYAYNGLVTNNYSITAKDIEIDSTGKITAGSSAIKVSGDFTNNGSFVYGTSVVSFQDTNQTITGNTTFYKLYKLVNESDTLTITAGNTITIASGGVMRFWGKPEGKTLSIVSSTPGTPYNITRTGTAELEYTNWSDANWSVAQTAAASSLGSGNTNLSVTKEFICTIRATGGDYSTLSTWENANQVDLTASTTKVFSHSGITGTIPDGSTLTGVTSGATGTVTHVTNTQALIHTITGTFQSGEQVYETQDTNYITISDAGFGAIATAHPYNDWGSGLDNNFGIAGWVTNANNFVNIYVPRSERHSGKLKNEDGNYSGFALTNRTNLYQHLIDADQSYTRFDGLILHQSWGTSYDGIGTGNFAKNIISNCILYDSVSGHQSLQSTTLENNPWTIYYNNITYGWNDGIMLYEALLYNNTVYKNGNGINLSYVDGNYNPLAKNNIVAEDIGFDFDCPTCFNSSSDYNISSDATAPGTNSLINQALDDIDFVSSDVGLEDLHIEISSVAKNKGIDLSVDPNFPIIDDIDGDSRLGLTWDIGADEVFSKTIIGESGDLTGVSSEGLVAHWTFDGGDIDWSNSTAEIRDTSGNANHGDAINSPSPTIGRLGQGLGFDGVDDYVDCGTGTALNITSAITLSAWIKPDTLTPTWQLIAGKRNPDGDYPAQYLLLLNGSQISFRGYDSTGSWWHAETTDANLIAGNVYHIAVYFDTETNDLKIFLNGIQKTVTTENLSNNIISNSYSFVIGKSLNNGNDKFDGIIDDVRIYNRALSEAEVGMLYRFGQVEMQTSQANNNSNGLVGYWSMNGSDINWSASTTEIKDRSGNGKDGDAINLSSSSVDFGKIGQAIRFDGALDYIDVGDVAQNINTISFWVKTNTTTEDIIDLDGGTHVVSVSSGTVSATGFSNPIVYIDGTENSTIDTDWHHVSITTDSAIDTLDMNIGKVGSNYFNGLIDEIRIYDYMLSDQEVTKLYNLGKVEIVK